MAAPISFLHGVERGVLVITSTGLVILTGLKEAPMAVLSRRGAGSAVYHHFVRANFGQIGVNSNMNLFRATAASSTDETVHWQVVDWDVGT